MKTKFIRLIQVLSALAALILSSVSTASADILPNDPDFGFTHDLRHSSVGDKTVLIFQSDTMIIGKAKFGVSLENVDANAEMLSKFLKWAEIAQQRNDEFTKEIGIARGFNFGLFDFWNRYEFQTTKSTSGVGYILCVQPGNKLFGMFKPKSVDNDAQAVGPVDFKMYFSQTQIRQIIQRMKDFKEGKLKSKAETASDYN